MAASEFSFSIGGDSAGVTPELLAAALENAVDLLKGVAADLAPEGGQVRYEVVAVSMNSPVRVTIAARGPDPMAEAVGRDAVEATLKGLRLIGQRAERPAHFDDAALESARRFVDKPVREGVPLRVYDPHRNYPPIESRVDLTSNIAAIVGQAITRTETGTIRGELHQITTRGTDSFAVWDSLHGHRVVCVPSDGDQFAVAAALLRRRVAVTGLIRYRDGLPVKVTVESLRPLPGPDDRLDLDSLPVIDLTGGRPSEEYVREMRDAE
jgi:hypothetical protein